MATKEPPQLQKPILLCTRHQSRAAGREMVTFDLDLISQSISGGKKRFEMRKGVILYLHRELSAGCSALETLLQIHGNLRGGPAALAAPGCGSGGCVGTAAAPAGWAGQRRDTSEHQVTLTQNDSSSPGLFWAVPGYRECANTAQGAGLRGGCLQPASAPAVYT